MMNGGSPGECRRSRSAPLVLHWQVQQRPHAAQQQGAGQCGKLSARTCSAQQTTPCNRIHSGDPPNCLLQINMPSPSSSSTVRSGTQLVSKPTTSLSAMLLLLVYRVFCGVHCPTRTCFMQEAEFKWWLKFDAGACQNRDWLYVRWSAHIPWYSVATAPKPSAAAAAAGVEDRKP
jgi:hypothetical protein